MLPSDEEIGRQLQAALAAGELQASPFFGKPLPEEDGWAATPPALRLPFKLLKNAGYRPPEVGWFHQRARLRERVAAAPEGDERRRLQAELSALEQWLALRLERLRLSERL